MSNRRHRKRSLIVKANVATKPKPMGYYRVEDHAKTVSIIRYYTAEEKQEITTLSLIAQLECKEKHHDMPGLCCVLWPSNEEEWILWH